jgi:hypothetical protein
MLLGALGWNLAWGIISAACISWLAYTRLEMKF